MPAALATALLALQLAGSPHAPPPPPVAGASDDAGDLARVSRLANRFDLAVARRDAALLALVEHRVREEIAGELDEARRERRRGIDRRVGALEKAGRTFAEHRERTDRRSLERKRSALADVSQAAWLELVEVAGGHEHWRLVREGPPEDRWDERHDPPYGRDDRGGRRQAEPPPPQPLRADQLDALSHAMRKEAFAEGKLRVLDTAIAGGDAWITVDQTGRLMVQLAFAKEKLELVRRVRPRLLDPQEGWRLYEAFAFDDDKAELRRILEQR